MIEFVYAILLIHGHTLQIYAKKSNDNGIFDGRLTRAHNTAVASNILDNFNKKQRTEVETETTERDAIFVTPQQVV